MSETVTLKAHAREHTGSKAAAKLRERGLMPVVVYGHKQEPMSVCLNGHEFIENLHHGHRIFALDLDGKKDTVMIKDLQYDHLGKDVIHADLMRVNLSERVKVEVMLELRGTAEGTHFGGIVEELMNAVEVECEVRSIPETLVVNIKSLGLNETMKAGRVELPAGVTLVTDPEAIIVSCHETKAAVAEEEIVAEGEEEGAEPEVITERKEEAEEKPE